jgi:hypothetical protein
MLESLAGTGPACATPWCDAKGELAPCDIRAGMVFLASRTVAAKELGCPARQSRLVKARPKAKALGKDG